LEETNKAVWDKYIRYETRGSLTKILEACFEVSRELGTGFANLFMRNRYLWRRRKKGFTVEAQVPLEVHFRGVLVGEFKPYLLVERKIIIEIKAVEHLVNAHFAQILNYLKITGLDVGIVVNFGNAKLEYRRFDNRMPKRPILGNLFDN
jgi:GxxExxY protein